MTPRLRASAVTETLRHRVIMFKHILINRVFQWYSDYMFFVFFSLSVRLFCLPSVACCGVLCVWRAGTVPILSDSTAVLRVVRIEWRSTSRSLTRSCRWGQNSQRSNLDCLSWISKESTHTLDTPQHSSPPYGLSPRVDNGWSVCLWWWKQQATDLLAL